MPIKASNFPKITNAGAVKNTFDYEFIAPAKASNYKVTVNYGTLRVINARNYWINKPEISYKIIDEIFWKVFPKPRFGNPIITKYYTDDCVKIEVPTTDNYYDSLLDFCNCDYYDGKVIDGIIIDAGTKTEYPGTTFQLTNNTISDDPTIPFDVYCNFKLKLPESIRNWIITNNKSIRLFVQPTINLNCTDCYVTPISDNSGVIVSDSSVTTNSRLHSLITSDSELLINSKTAIPTSNQIGFKLKNSPSVKSIGYGSVQNTDAYFITADITEKINGVKTVTGKIIKGYNKDYKTNVLDKLSSYTLAIPNNISGVPVKGIKKDAFRSNTKIKSVILPYGLEYIEGTAFYECTGLSGDIYIPSTVNQINHCCFRNTNLSNVYILGQPFLKYEYDGDYGLHHFPFRTEKVVNFRNITLHFNNDILNKPYVSPAKVKYNTYKDFVFKVSGCTQYGVAGSTKTNTIIKNDCQFGNVHIKSKATINSYNLTLKANYQKTVLTYGDYDVSSLRTKEKTKSTTINLDFCVPGETCIYDLNNDYKVDSTELSLADNIINNRFSGESYDYIYYLQNRLLQCSENRNMTEAYNNLKKIVGYQ